MMEKFTTNTAKVEKTPYICPSCQGAIKSNEDISVRAGGPMFNELIDHPQVFNHCWGKGSLGSEKCECGCGVLNII